LATYNQTVIYSSHTVRVLSKYEARNTGSDSASNFITSACSKLSFGYSIINATGGNMEETA